MTIPCADRVARRCATTAPAKYHNEVVGYNSRLDELQAAFLRAKLRISTPTTTTVAEIAAIYLRGLADVPELLLPRVPAWSGAGVAPLRHPHASRDALANGSPRRIGTMIHYPVAPHLQPAYAFLNRASGALPIAEALHREVLSLPIGPAMTLSEAASVADAIRRFR